MDLSRNKLGGKYKRSREGHREEAIQGGREGGAREPRRKTQPPAFSNSRPF